MASKTTRTSATVRKSSRSAKTSPATVQKYVAEVKNDKAALLKLLNNTQYQESWQAMVKAISKNDPILRGLNMGRLAEVIVNQSRSPDANLEYWVEEAKKNNKTHKQGADFQAQMGGQTFYQLKTNRSRIRIFDPMDLVIDTQGRWNRNQSLPKVIDTFVKVGLSEMGGGDWRWAIFPTSSKYLMGYLDVGQSTMKAFLRLKRGKGFFKFESSKSLVFLGKKYGNFTEIEEEVGRLLRTARENSIDREFLARSATAGGAGKENQDTVRSILKQFRAFIAATYTLRMDINDDLVNIFVLELGAIIRTPIPREGNITYFYKMLDRAFGKTEYIKTYRDSQQGAFGRTWENKQVENYYNYRYPNSEY